MTGMPLVSIVTPVRNCARFLPECIESVARQTYPNVEHIIIDGQSDDGTLAVLVWYQQQYPHIRYLSEKDSGPCDAWNKGWEMSRGDIFGFLGGDDLLMPDAAEIVVEFFANHPSAMFVFGDCMLMDVHGRDLRLHLTRPFSLFRQVNCGNYIPTPSAFYRRELIRQVGALDTSINCCDLDYWIRVGQMFEMHRINRVLSRFRRHPNSISVQWGENQRNYVREGYILWKRYHGHPLAPRRLAYLIDRCPGVTWLIPLLRWLYHQWERLDSKGT